MQDRAKPDPSFLSVELGLAARGGNSLSSGLSTQVRFASDIELNRLDLVGACRDNVDQQTLHVVEVGGLQRKRRLALIAEDLRSAPKLLHELRRSRRDRSIPESGTWWARSASLTARTASLATTNARDGVCSSQITLKRARTKSGTAFTLAAPYAAIPQGRSIICMPH
jgi:hypothetical protein